MQKPKTIRNFRLTAILVALILSCAARANAQSASIQSIVSAGKLDTMRWPNFSDYRVWLQKFYEPAGYAPAWIQGNAPTGQAQGMIVLFRESWRKGLEPEDYDFSRWDGRVQGLKSGGDPAQFDVAMTVCTMRYISDLHIGRINPRHFKFDLNVDQKKYDLAQFLRERILPANDLAAVAASAEPPFPTYRRTEDALVRYIELAQKDDGEKLPEPAKAIDVGKEYAGVPRLVRLLTLVGDLPQGTSAGDGHTYTAEMAEGVKRFQSRHGLDTDGRLGSSTVKAMNIPLASRVFQTKLTLERWRWIPAEFTKPPIIVNIPDFKLRALDENNKVAVEMSVVVGKAMRNQTPVFTRDMTYVVLRPYWNVPPGIMKRDVIPGISKDRNQVVTKNYEITTLDGKVVTSSAPSDDVLAQLRAGKLTVRQKPGPRNSLGLIKLMFPNEYNVYLHSTPATELFSRSRRDFSSGCIRVEKPAVLGAWVLRNNPGWPVDRVQDQMDNGKDNVTIKLSQIVPVFIVYGTAVAYENNEVHFYDDIYGHDAKLAEALAKGYPYP